MKVEYLSPDELIPYSKNAKQHLPKQVDQIAHPPFDQLGQVCALYFERKMEETEVGVKTIQIRPMGSGWINTHPVGYSRFGSKTW